MKARKVHGVDPDAPLADGVQRIVEVRLAELCSFMPRARDPQEVQSLHDLRIAAKRLRYLLEMFGTCFGAYAPKAARHAKAVQDLVGEIHDCDVTLPRVQELLDELCERDAREIRALAPADATDLDAALISGAPHADAFRGLESLRVYLRARRELLFARFLELWTDLEREGFRARLEFAVTERAPVEAEPVALPRTITSRSHGSNGGAEVVRLPSAGTRQS